MKTAIVDLDSFIIRATMGQSPSVDVIRTYSETDSIFLDAVQITIYDKAAIEGLRDFQNKCFPKKPEAV